MISYPAEILARFGRYEAIAQIDERAGANLWKAWDPFLERFVLVVALPGLDQAELCRLGPDLETLLEGQQLGPRRRVLDFAPPSAGTDAFFVVEFPGSLRRAGGSPRS